MVLLAESQSFCKIVFAFSWKSTDDISRDGNARDTVTQNVDNFTKVVTCVFASHLRQNGVTPALHRDVQELVNSGVLHDFRNLILF